MKLEPVAFVWDGAVMVPLDRFRPLARRQYHPGQEYALVQHLDRSDASHRHYFACVRKGWENLPERMTERLPTPEHLRKRCLVWEGYADHTEIPCVDEESMGRLIAVIRKADEYAVMTREGLVLNIWNAQSQDHVSMGHDAFQRSKDAVLGRIAMLCGITVKELTVNSKTNA
jgi:hypothetical protein